jgi:transposase
MNRIEVITSVERRRRWSRTEKERWVSALMEPGAVAADVAREAQRSRHRQPSETNLFSPSMRTGG